MLIKGIMETGIKAYSQHKGKRKQVLYEKYKGKWHY